MWDCTVCHGLYPTQDALATHSHYDWEDKPWDERLAYHEEALGLFSPLYWFVLVPLGVLFWVAVMYFLGRWVF